MLLALQDQPLQSDLCLTSLTVVDQLDRVTVLLTEQVIVGVVPRIIFVGKD